MGIFSKLFGQNENSKFKPKQPLLDLIFYEALVDRIAVSDNLKRELKDELKKAFEKPKSFYDDNNEYILTDRGLRYSKGVSETAKFVLIDTLIDNGQMAEVDWKEEENEIRVFLNEIRIAKNYDLTIDDEDLHEGYNTGEILKLIDEKELKAQGYSLVILDINSDSYVFTIVSFNQKHEIEEMFVAMR